jgi:hypothetical protein
VVRVLPARSADRNSPHEALPQAAPDVELLSVHGHCTSYSRGQGDFPNPTDRTPPSWLQGQPHIPCLLCPSCSLLFPPSYPFARLNSHLCPSHAHTRPCAHASCPQCSSPTTLPPSQPSSSASRSSAPAPPVTRTRVAPTTHSAPAAPIPMHPVRSPQAASQNTPLLPTCQLL